MAIEAVFFDFMGTLARFVPEQEVLLSQAAGIHGVLMPPTAAHRGFAAAGAWWQQQVAKLPLSLRTERGRRELYRQFDLRVIRGAGFELPPDHAEAIFTTMLDLGAGSRLEVYDDVVPTLAALAESGHRLGVISNMDASLRTTLAALDLDAAFPIAVSSEEAGLAKPDPAIFGHTAGLAGLDPAACVYVGDQPAIDLPGAQAAGFTAVLVDRANVHADPDHAIRIRTLTELPTLLNLLG